MKLLCKRWTCCCSPHLSKGTLSSRLIGTFALVLFASDLRAQTCCSLPHPGKHRYTLYWHLLTVRCGAPRRPESSVRPAVSMFTSLFTSLREAAEAAAAQAAAAAAGGGMDSAAATANAASTLLSLSRHMHDLRGLLKVRRN